MGAIFLSALRTWRAARCAVLATLWAPLVARWRVDKLADPMGARFERGAHSSRGVSLRGCGRVRWSAAASFGPSSEASSLSADSAGAAALAVGFRAVLSVGLGGAGA